MIRKPFLFISVVFLTYSYTVPQKVSGTVTDTSGAPVPGVSVIIKGTTIGTVTDMSGKYTIEVAERNAILVFSFIGMKSVEVTVGNQNPLDIKLCNEEIVVDDLIVAMNKKPVQMQKNNYATVRVFFASDRNLTNTKEPKDMFGTGRSNVSYGMCEVSIPRDHRMGELEKASIWKFQFRNDPEKHVTLLKVKVQSKEDFFIKLKYY